MSLLLRSGLTYFNVHTSNVSTGELRAQRGLPGGRPAGDVVARAVDHVQLVVAQGPTDFGKARQFELEFHLLCKGRRLSPGNPQKRTCLGSNPALP